MTMADGLQETVIAPKRSRVSLDLAEVYRFRELLFFLVWRDIKVRYKQSLLCVGWVLIRPLVSMLIFSFIFGRLARLPSEGVPYPVFVLLGLIPWGYFSGTFTDSTGSVVAGGNLISKVYFPRIIVPVSGSLSQLVDVFISMFLLVGVMLYYGVTPGASALLSPVLLVFVALTALGPGMILSALNVKYRDVRHLVPFLVQVWMYLTPVLYPASFVPEKYRWLMYLNPMTGVTESFRAAFLPGKQLDAAMLGVSASVSALMFVAGLYYFKSVERTFADNI